jgi:FkbM family methyltransferase
MSNFFDITLHYLGQNQENVFIVNIGAMDGIMFDEIYKYTSIYNFKGLYVEPIPYLFAKLKNNIGLDNLFENSAISSYNGEIEMIMIDRDVIDHHQIPEWFYGMSAVFPPKNGLGNENTKCLVEKYGKLIRVPCITFETLMLKHNISKFDILQIDAEGHDYEIFQQIDLDKYKPKILHIEWMHLSNEEKRCMIDIFNAHDYLYEITGQDVNAMSRSFYDQIQTSHIYCYDDKMKSLTTHSHNLYKNTYIM